MVLKIINATEARTGTMILVDGDPLTVRSNDISKTGKHGHAKCRMEAVGVFSGKKKVITVPGHERFDVPEVVKKKAQVLSVDSDMASVMDLESYETISVGFDEELRDKLKADEQVEYWTIEDQRKIMRML